jgi:lysozyme
VAHYLQPHQPRIKRQWTFWQHSEKGRVNGIISRVDFNVFNGDSTEFRLLLVP